MQKVKTLKAQHNFLANVHEQIEIIEHGQTGNFALAPFQQKLEAAGLFPLKPAAIDIFQVNMGKMCNQVCSHCHVDAGPDRKEIMSKETMQQCLHIIRNDQSFTTVDLTGGAPEMNLHFRWFVGEIKKMNRTVLVRSNLTIILANKKYHDLPEFFKENNVQVIASLPCYTKENTDRQRGDGVFEDSIKALQMLNAVGYGKENSGLKLTLVYNPGGASLPPPQQTLETDYKQKLLDWFGISFNNLYVITNMPISRFLNYLLESGKYETYMEKLVNAYNPVAAANVMCRNTISIGWDGYIYDCDFNQMLELKVDCHSRHIAEFNKEALTGRSIVVGQHCYGCTAGAGSSCGGAVA
ncbi:arsenosugar biosynthesis radical SAM (seleno)protein ArsS [Niastella populi]|uniref:Radical SAM protein n=1 Tax=Niastella populi TaxID=550983 RepID=A0A1V9FPS0_9BACT|nr:arsenosugar biosynthesis radical SAM (seleno)protein ArsS [Niastella populi]OQP60330.1 radical SAM protein [Niastella populi]